jgi:transposase
VARAEKKAIQQGWTIAWVDEAAFYLLPATGRTYAPRGETPIVRVRLTRDHLGVIGALTQEGRLLLHVQQGAYHGPDVVCFLRHLVRQIEGAVLIIWDGAPIHRARVVKEFLATAAGQAVQLAQLPAYAPELNPVEGIWHQLKQVELKNVCCHDLGELGNELQLATARLRHRRAVLLGCIEECGY